MGLDNDRSTSRGLATHPRKGLDPGCNPRMMMLTAVLLVLTLVGIWVINREPSAEQIARSRLAIERAEALQPWTIALGVALRGVAIAAGVVLLMGLVMAIRSAARWLDTQSRLIRPDQQTGQFPAVKVRRGEAVVDLNRLPDGKAMTGVVGGKTALLLVLFLRYVLGKDVPELTEQPAILIRPPDTSLEQMRVTAQAQAGQALAAASRGMTPGEAVQAARALLPQQRPPPGLPPLLAEGYQPREVQLLLEAGKRQWDQSQDEEVVEGTAHLLEGG